MLKGKKGNVLVIIGLIKSYNFKQQSYFYCQRFTRKTI